MIDVLRKGRRRQLPIASSTTCTQKDCDRQVECCARCDWCKGFASGQRTDVQRYGKVERFNFISNDVWIFQLEVRSNT